jgi:hypothetical protein
MIKEFDVAFIQAEMEKKQKQFLHAVGSLAVAIASGHAPHDMGALRNSIIYKLSDGSGSKFGTAGPNSSGKSKGKGKGDTIPPESAKITASDNKDYVKVGSNLIYANRREWEGKGSGYMAKTLDEMERSGVMNIAEKVFRW